MAVSLSGQFGSQGRQALQGASAWVRDVNANDGGMYVASAGRRLPVDLVHYDDGSTVHGARSMVQRLIVDDGVDILLGPYSSVLTLAACGVAEEHGAVLWNHGGASDRIYEQGFRRCVGVLAPASRYLTGLVDLLVEQAPRPRRVAILHARRGTFPAAVASGLEEKASGQGWETVLRRAYQDVSDFPALLEEVEAAAPDLVAGVGRIQEDLEMARQIRSKGLKAEAVSLVAAGVAEFGRELGDLADGFMGPSQWEPSASPAPEYGPTADQLALRHPGFAPGKGDYAMAQAYAAGLVVGRCVEEAGGLDPDALREAASRLDFTTFYGRFKIDADTGRQTGRSVNIVRWREGRKAVVWPPEAEKTRGPESGGFDSRSA